MITSKHIFGRAAAISAALSALLLCAAAGAREITDMSGRKVEVPDRIEHIYAMTHSFPLIVAIAPDLLAGMAWPIPPSADLMHFLPRGLEKLPMLGAGKDANLEKLKSAGVDVAFGWTTPTEQYPVKQLERINVPVVFIDVDRVNQYPGTFRFLGRLLHREKRGELLAKTLENTMTKLSRATAKIKDADKARVYYAESIDGLTSQCDTSPRAEVIALAGAKNALHCDKNALLADHYTVDSETLLTMDPDVIVTRFAKTATDIAVDPRWRHLRAVREKRVYAVPNLPFNWFHRPPSFLRAMGAEWLANTLYPKVYPIDMRQETKRFYRTYFGYDLNEADVNKLLNP
jgi:iron complex transport system substrate-binding protein